MKVRVDLHIHTCLSPCGDYKMLPKTIIEEAGKKGLGIIAISDHNTCANFRVVAQAAKGSGITVLPAIEATSREEVHTLAVFEDIRACAALEKFILEELDEENDPDKFGYQIVVDKSGEIIGAETKFLLGTPSISLETMVDKIKALGGIAIASHIDRDAFSIIGQLGFVPEGLKLDALEVSPRVPLEKAKDKFGIIESLPYVTFSDAHFPEDIGKAYTEMELPEASFKALQEYLRNAPNN